MARASHSIGRLWRAPPQRALRCTYGPDAGPPLPARRRSHFLPHGPGTQRAGRCRGRAGNARTAFRRLTQPTGPLPSPPLSCVVQIKQEVAGVLDFIHAVYGHLGMSYTMKLSTRPKKALGDVELWRVAEAVRGVPYRALTLCLVPRLTGSARPRSIWQTRWTNSSASGTGASTRATAPSTGPRSTLRCLTPWAVLTSAPPSNWTSSCPSDSICPTREKRPRCGDACSPRQTRLPH